MLELSRVIALMVSGTFALAGLLFLLMADPSPLVQHKRRHLIGGGVVLLVLDAALSIRLYASMLPLQREHGVVPHVFTFHLVLLCVAFGRCGWTLLRSSATAEALPADEGSAVGCLLVVALIVVGYVLSFFSSWANLMCTVVLGLVVGLGAWQGAASYAVPFRWGLIPLLLGAVVIYAVTWYWLALGSLG
jgi:hypothetical protein